MNVLIRSVRRYLDSALGVGPPRSFFDDSEDRLSSISLAELEMALENLTAAIYWSGMCGFTVLGMIYYIETFSVHSRASLLMKAANTIPSNGESVSFLTSTTSEMSGILLYNPNDQLNVGLNLHLTSYPRD